jgi:alginate O-acetyltransferase complex protein AlgI
VIFTSWVFVLFFLVVVLGLCLAPGRTVRQALILVAGLVFYGWWDYRFLALLAAPSIIDYVSALRIEAAASAGHRRAWLWFSLVSNLGLLAYFKYADFFLASLAAALGRDHHALHVILPVGISFYTFKTLSYTIDVYRGRLVACRSLWRYAMYVTYFPELVAGPIVRAAIFLPQMARSLRPSWSRAAAGVQRVALGFTKKLVVADRLAPFVDAVFAAPEVYSPLTVWSAVLAYALQIYCDFSGYTDIALGTSRILGFDLPENFHMPYLAASPAEFWRRWHITLSTWLRDYLYIPLGGNRQGRLRTYANLLVTMLLGGLWHGAAWTFVAWGAWHGLGLAMHRLWRDRGLRMPRALAWPLTLLFVLFGWVLFRARTFPDAALMFRKMLWLDANGVSWFYLPLLLLLALVAVAHGIGLAVERARFARGRRAVIPLPTLLQRILARPGGLVAWRAQSSDAVFPYLRPEGFAAGALLTLWGLLLALFAAGNSQPFIYFQF